MKTYSWLAATLTLISLCAGGQVTLPLLASVPVIVQSGPHHRIWQTISVDEQGQTNVSSYTELATGLNYFNPASGTWEESRAEFKITENGYAVATNGQHQVVISPALNDANGAVTVQAPDGKRFRSTILGLNLYDRLSGKSLLIAELTNSVGQLISPNQVLFPACF